MTLIELARKLRPYIEKAAISLSDADALEAVQLFPTWHENIEVAVGDRYREDGILYRCRQGHTTQASWKPSLTPALWEVIVLDHEGTQSDPIPYEVGMEIFNGKYYTQNEVLYRCIRDSGIPLSFNLSDLIGIYVEEVV